MTTLSHVSAPISPQQQCHLAFISEFNVSILYLPGLKNVVADFLSHPPPHWSHLEPSPLRLRRIQLTLKPWLLSITAVQKCSICSAVHPSNLLSNKQVLNAWLAIFPRKFFVPLSQQNSEKKTFFCICIAFPTLGGWPPGALCLQGLSGATSPMTSPLGKFLPALPAEQDPPTHLPATAAHPHSPTAVCSSPH